MTDHEQSPAERQMGEAEFTLPECDIGETDSRGGYSESLVRSIVRAALASTAPAEAGGLPYEVLFELAAFFNLSYSDVVEVADDFVREFGTAPAEPVAVTGERLGPNMPLDSNLRALANQPQAAIDAFGVEWAGWCAASALDAIHRTHPAAVAGEPQVPSGWKLVPEEPTLEMGWAYLEAARKSSPLIEHAFNHPGYRAALAASPSPKGGA